MQPTLRVHSSYVMTLPLENNIQKCLKQVKGNKPLTFANEPRSQYSNTSHVSNSSPPSFPTEPFAMLLKMSCVDIRLFLSATGCVLESLRSIVSTVTPWGLSCWRVCIIKVWT